MQAIVKEKAAKFENMQRLGFRIKNWGPLTSLNRSKIPASSQPNIYMYQIYVEEMEIWDMDTMQCNMNAAICQFLKV